MIRIINTVTIRILRLLSLKSPLLLPSCPDKERHPHHSKNKADGTSPGAIYHSGKNICRQHEESSCHHGTGNHRPVIRTCKIPHNVRYHQAHKSHRTGKRHGTARKQQDHKKADRPGAFHGKSQPLAASSPRLSSATLPERAAAAAQSQKGSPDRRR